ncbi:hypothetical protein QE152_g36265 [Popillia japonica]|uniref:Uncharacterized protein n=1 Tax=Popillia japonica TaxID=7064 RepID=A0AAW1IDP8_POPJA
MMSIMLYSDEITRPRYITCYISKHLLHDIREETPFNNVVLSMFDMTKHQNLDFGKTAASNRIYYEKLCDLFSYIKTDIHKTDYVNDIYSIVCEIATFNADDRTNQIPLDVYGNLLEACEITQQYWLNDVLGHFANNDPKNDYFYDLFWTRSTAAFRPKFHKFVVANPAAYLRHILLDSETMIKVLTKLRLDYVPIEIKQFLDNYCLDILQIEDYTHSRLETVFKVFLKLNENTFLNIFMKMWMENRDSRPQIISLQTQLLTQLRNIHAVFPICLKLFKEEGCEKCKAAVLRCLQLMPLHQSKKTICNLSVSPQFRLRNLSVSAAGVLFANDDLTRFISEMNGRETDPVLKGNLCKRSFRLFLKNQTDLSWRLFQTNIELSGDEPGFIAKFWLHLHQIAPVYLKKFVEYTFEIVIKDGSTNKWTKTLAKRLNSKSMLENLNTTFVQTLMKSFRFDERRG